VKLTDDVKQRKKHFLTIAYKQTKAYKTKKVLPGFNEVNPKFDIQIDDVSEKALSHNFPLSMFQSLDNNVWFRKKVSTGIFSSLFCLQITCGCFTDSILPFNIH